MTCKAWTASPWYLSLRAGGVVIGNAITALVRRPGRYGRVLRPRRGRGGAPRTRHARDRANNLGVLLFRACVRMRECLESKGVRGSADAGVY